MIRKFILNKTAWIEKGVNFFRFAMNKLWEIIKNWKKNRSDKIIMYYNSVNKVKLCFTALK